MIKLSLQLWVDKNNRVEIIKKISKFVVCQFMSNSRRSVKKILTSNHLPDHALYKGLLGLKALARTGALAQETGGWSKLLGMDVHAAGEQQCGQNGDGQDNDSHFFLLGVWMLLVDDVVFVAGAKD